MFRSNDGKLPLTPSEINAPMVMTSNLQLHRNGTCRSTSVEFRADFGTDGMITGAMPGPNLVLAQDLTPAEWIVDRIHAFAVDVGSIIPEGFPAYARLFHPAARSAGDEEIPVSWSEVAAARGRTVHPEMQWANIAGAELDEPSPDPELWERGPREAYLPRPYAQRLAELLEAHTSTSERVWFAIWNGWGGLTSDFPNTALLRSDGARRFLRRPAPWVRPTGRSRLSAPTFHLPERDYYLFTGPLDAITTSFDPFGIPAQLWWPDDRAWCVATEIDFAWTYLGGTEECVKAILADSEIEALAIEVRHRITHDSDHINPPPGSTT